MTWERDLGPNALSGVYIDAEFGPTLVNDELAGTIDTAGLNLGACAAKRLSGDIILDGFVNAARLHDRRDR